LINPVQNIVENETSSINDHCEMTSVMNREENTGLLRSCFSEIQTASWTQVNAETK